MQFPARNADVYVADMERVEVLEGPQGTLFGGGAQAGVVRYITNKPKLSKFEGRFEGSFGGTSGGSTNASFNAVGQRADRRGQAGRPRSGRRRSSRRLHRQQAVDLHAPSDDLVRTTCAYQGNGNQLTRTSRAARASMTTPRWSKTISTRSTTPVAASRWALQVAPDWDLARSRRPTRSCSHAARSRCRPTRTTTRPC